MVQRGSPSAVAVIETPRTFAVEGRPNNPGRLAYAGKLQLFGGHIEQGETPLNAVLRELYEEVDLRPPIVPNLLAEGDYLSQDRTGAPVVQHVSLFLVIIDSVGRLRLKVPGEIVEIPKNAAAIEARKDMLTPFAYITLGQLARREAVRWA